MVAGAPPGHAAGCVSPPKLNPVKWVAAVDDVVLPILLDADT